MSISVAVASLLSSASAVALTQAPVQLAQNTVAADDQAADTLADYEVAEADETGGSSDGAIVVTGSRVVTDGSRAPTPLVVVSADQLAANAPQGINEGLNQLPIFQGSQNANMTQLSLNTRIRSGNYMNLRFLGPPRVLILMDGNRLPPSGNYGAVDSNVIPQMLIERVDVVTGGASAVYGSDAVSGVVNYVIDKNFTGLKTLAQYGVSAYDDSHSYKVGAAFGTSVLDDRLQIQLSGEYTWNQGIPTNSRGAQDGWSIGALDPTLALGPQGSITNPILDYRGTRSSTTSDYGLIYGGPPGLVNMRFNAQGQLIPFERGTPIGLGDNTIGGDGPEPCLECSSLTAQTDNLQFFARATYDFGGNIEGFIQGGYNQAGNRGKTGYSTGNRVLYNDNYYLQQALTPAQYALMGASVNFRRPLREWGSRYTYQDMESIFVNGGLSGPLFGDWSWNVGASYGKTDFQAYSPQEILNERLAAATDAVDDGNGRPVCRVTLVSNRFPDCKPINLIGEGTADPAAIAWVLGDSEWGVVNDLYSASVGFSGTAFHTWAGPVSLAFGAEWRKQSIVQTSNGRDADYTDIRGGSGNYFASTNVGASPRGTYNVKEVYVETSVPLIDGASFTESLELNGALRYTDYSTSGGVTTYKIGATWEPVSGIVARGAYSRDMRAPGLTELFGAVTNIQRSVFDYLTQAEHLVDNPSGGNLDLVPEEADTYTAGVVLRPAFLPGFYASVDYFDITINNAIGQPGTLLQIFSACTSNPNNALCDLIIRAPDNTPLSVSGKNENIAVISTSGIDFEAGYRTPLGAGDLNFRALATRLISFKRQDTPATELIEYAGTMDLPGFLSGTYPLPKWRGSLNISYSDDKFSVGVQERMIGSYVKSRGNTYYVDNHIPVVFYTDINASVNFQMFGGEAELFTTVNNLFNKAGPLFVPPATGGGVPTSRAVYDITGRYITVGVRGRF